MSNKYDIIIAGDGILGYSTAFALLQKDPMLKIAIVASQHKNAATLASGAMLNCFSELTETSFLTNTAQSKFQMAFEALKKWPAWLDKINEYSPKKVLSPRGTYILLNSKSGSLDTSNFYAIIKALKTYNEPYQEVSPKEIPGINPLDSCRPLQSLYLPNEGYINPSFLLATLQQILCSSCNVKIVYDSVEKINYSDGIVRGVTLASGKQLSSGKVILATGAFTQKLINKIPEIKDQIPMSLSGAGFALTIKPKQHSIQHIIRTPNRAGACGLHVVPREGDLYVGATNNVYLNPKTKLSAGLTQFLIKCAIEQINQDFYSAEIKDFIVGNRPVTIDTFPLLGEVSIEGLFLLAGTYRDGLHLSPYLSEYMANLILGTKKENDNPFTPERSFIQTKNIPDAIDEFILHYFAGSYEHGMVLPAFLSEKNFCTLLRQKIQTLHDELEIDFGLSPDIILMTLFEENEQKAKRTLKKHLAGLRLQKFKNVA